VANHLGVNAEEQGLGFEHLICQGDLLTFATSDLDNGAAVVFFKLALSNGNGFNAAVGAGGNMPEKVHVFPPALVIKPWRYHQQVYITPSIGMTACLGAKDDPVANGDTPFD